MPIQKRILHILAVRPYKRSDLLTKLMSDGLKDSDKKRIDSLFASIIKDYNSVRHNPNELLHLNSEYKNHIDVTWPFYSASELQLVKRNLEIFRSKKGRDLSLTSSSAINQQTQRISSSSAQKSQQIETKQKVASNFSVFTTLCLPD